MKVIRNVLIGLFCVVSVAAGLIWRSFSRALPIAPHQELSGGAIQVKDGWVSAGLVPSGDKQAILVDCGSESSATMILEELRRMGLEKASVRAILLTHAHSDHIGGCGAFPEAQILAMAAERPMLEGAAGSRSHSIRIARFLEDGESFHAGTAIVTAYLIPGHTAGSAAYLIAGTLYMGDSADSGRDGTLLPAKRFVSASVDENRRSLAMLARRLAPQAAAIEFMEFAHSGPFRGIGPLLEFAKR